MTADVITLFPARQEVIEAARSEYRKAVKQFRIVSATMKLTDPDAQSRYREADWWRRLTFERYMRALSEK